MDKLKVIELAKEAGLALTDHGHPEGYAVFCERLERFAALVRAEADKELEKLAELVVDQAKTITAYQVRQWVDLTDDEMRKHSEMLDCEPDFNVFRAVIAAFKEKNK